jgi:hypothetical protein
MRLHNKKKINNVKVLPNISMQQFEKGKFPTSHGKQLMKQRLVKSHSRQKIMHPIFQVYRFYKVDRHDNSFLANNVKPWELLVMDS